MGMLDRYRKPGGFFQLLSLIETCGPAKQEKFLEIIRAEDARWADAVRVKMLDMNRIYSWSDETLAEIIGTLQDLTLAIALHAAPNPIKAKINAMLTHGRRRKIDDLYGSNNPSAGELAATHLKIIETVRKMAHDGFIRFEKIDPSLHLDEKTEDALIKPPGPVSLSVSTAPSTSSSDFKIEYETPNGGNESVPVEAETKEGGKGNEASTAQTAELSMLRKKLTELSKEVAVLRHELSIARTKLDQIKRIA
jgi:hypothetical protein